MSRAQELAKYLDQGNYAMRDLKEVAALLRQQDALLRQALDALLAQQEAIDGVPTGPERQVQWAIDAIEEHLK